jgi:hypothetical protein
MEHKQLNQPSGRVVQIGAVLANVRTGRGGLAIRTQGECGGAILTEDRGADRDHCRRDIDLASERFRAVIEERKRQKR